MIIGVGWGHTTSQDFTSVIDHQVQLETVKPVDRGMASLGNAIKPPVLADTMIVAHLQGG